jgi:hypothetical protein
VHLSEGKAVTSSLAAECKVTHEWDNRQCRVETSLDIVSVEGQVFENVTSSRIHPGPANQAVRLQGSSVVAEMVHEDID